MKWASGQVTELTDARGSAGTAGRGKFLGDMSSAVLLGVFKMLVEKMRPFERLIGDFRAERALLVFQGEGQEVDLDLRAEEVLNGFGIKFSITGEAEGIGLLDEIDLVGYDAGAEKYHVFTVDNQGTVHDHIGELSEDDKITVRWEGIIEGMPAHEEASMKFLDRDTVLLEDREYVGEEELMRLEGTFRRR